MTLIERTFWLLAVAAWVPIGVGAVGRLLFKRGEHEVNGAVIARPGPAHSDFALAHQEPTEGDIHTPGDS